MGGFAAADRNVCPTSISYPTAGSGIALVGRNTAVTASNTSDGVNVVMQR